MQFVWIDHLPPDIAHHHNIPTLARFITSEPGRNDLIAPIAFALLQIGALFLVYFFTQP